MGSTMVELIQECTEELGIPTPSTVAGNNSQDVVQLLALMNAVGYELLRRADWRELTRQHTFYTEATTATGNWVNGVAAITGLASTAGLDTTYQVQGVGIPNATYVTSVGATSVTLNYQTTETVVGGQVIFQKVKYGLPPDYVSTVNRTHWDKSKRWEMLGPESPQQWEWLLSGYISTGPRIRWRLLGKYFQIWPGMNGGELLGFEYRSNGWANAANGTTQIPRTNNTNNNANLTRQQIATNNAARHATNRANSTGSYALGKGDAGLDDARAQQIIATLSGRKNLGPNEKNRLRALQ